MARGFKNTPRGYTAYFEKPELLLIRDLAEDIVALLQPETGQDADPLDALIGITDNPQVPTDPAVSRLLPVGSSDEEAAAEYRRYTERDLRERKIANLSMLAFDIESADLLLDEEHARAWASALSDIRLVLATRLDITDDARAEEIHRYVDWSQIETVDEYRAMVYNFISWVQESLMSALMDGLHTP